MRSLRELSRREEIQTATAIALMGTAAAGEAGAFPGDSGLLTGKPRKLKYGSLPGVLSKAQVPLSGGPPTARSG